MPLYKFFQRPLKVFEVKAYHIMVCHVIIGLDRVMSRYYKAL